MHAFFQEFCYEYMFSPVPVQLSSSLSEQSIHTILEQLTDDKSQTKINQFLSSDLPIEGKAKEPIATFVKFSVCENSFNGSEYINENRLKCPLELNLGNVGDLVCGSVWTWTASNLGTVKNRKASFL